MAALRHRPTTVVSALVALALLLALGGCGDDDEDPVSAGDEGEGAAVTAEDLDGRVFVSSSVEGEELVDGSTIRFTFEDGNLATIAGCNTMTGGYSIDGDRLEAGPLAQTMMACSDELMAQDDWIAALLEGGPTIALDGDVLVLSLDGTTIRADAEG